MITPGLTGDILYRQQLEPICDRALHRRGRHIGLLPFEYVRVASFELPHRIVCTSPVCLRAERCRLCRQCQWHRHETKNYNRPHMFYV